TTQKTTRKYRTVAAVNKQNLAVGYDWPERGIDLIDLGGRVTRQIYEHITPLHMDITEDRHLVFSAENGTIARVQVDSGTLVFQTSGLSSL
ncbi:hypothetical protein PoB_002288800, partial [Plakobranchus ocellatus]